MLWTDSAKQFIRDNANLLTDQQIACRLTLLLGQTVTLWAVRRCRHRLGLRKRRGRGYCEVLPS